MTGPIPVFRTSRDPQAEHLKGQCRQASHSMPSGLRSFGGVAVVAAGDGHCGDDNRQHDKGGIRRCGDVSRSSAFPADIAVEDHSLVAV